MTLLNNLKDNWKRADKYTKWALYIIIIGALIRFILASINHISGDPCWHVNVVRFMVENNKIPLFEPTGRIPFWPPPLIEIIGALFYKFFLIFGKNIAEFSIRLISPISGTLMLVYMFLLSKKLFNTKIAFYSTLFLTFIPDHIYHSSMFFPDITVALLILMGIYYALKDKIFISGIVIGLALLTKYNALFALPVPILIIISNNFKDKIKIIKSVLLFATTSFIVSCFWYVRNYVSLGNPVFPLVNNLFTKGAVGLGGKIYWLNIIDPKQYLMFYLSFFGVPNGYYQNLFFLRIPFLKLILAVWFLGSFLFIFPVLFSLFKIKFKNNKFFVLGAWLLCYALFSFFLMTGNPPIGTHEGGDSFLSRYLIPIFPIIAILWAIGFSEIYKIKHNTLKLGVLLLLIFSLLGFTTFEFVKANVVKNSWNFYKPDFDWVKQNTAKNVKILVPGGCCYSYNLDRATYNSIEPIFKNNLIDAIKEYNMSYIWVNQKDTLYGKDPDNPVRYSEVFIKEIENSFDIVYENKETGTLIYKTTSLPELETLSK